MPKRKRSQGERAHDFQLVGQLDSMGCSQEEIRNALNDDRAKRGLRPLSKSQVQYDVKKAREDQAQRAEQEIRLARGRRMAQLNLIFREAFKAWMASKRMTKNVTEVSSPRSRSGKVIESQKVKKEVQDIPGGDSRLLLVMLKTTELQSHLGGLQHPEIEQPLEEHPQFVKELDSLEEAHALLDRVTGSRHGRSGKLLLWRGKDRKLV
jgi:hypothetical protein